MICNDRDKFRPFQRWFSWSSTKIEITKPTNHCCCTSLKTNNPKNLLLLSWSFVSSCESSRTLRYKLFSIISCDARDASCLFTIQNYSRCKQSLFVPCEMNEVLLNNYLTTNWGNWSSSIPCEKKVWMELNTLHLLVVGCS